MAVDIEEILSRELREVAADLTVPPLPALPAAPPTTARVLRHWQPLLVAAVVLLLAAGIAVIVQGQENQEPIPAPSPTPTAPTESPSPNQPSPSPSENSAPTRIPRAAADLPFVLGQQLYVAGQQVPGTWWTVEAGAEGWIALRTDGTWWWGNGPEANRIEGLDDNPPVISPNGRYVAMTSTQNGEGVLTGFDTRPAGEGFGVTPIDLGDRQDGTAVTVRAVTDDGRVIAQGSETSVLWLPLVIDGGTFDLTDTARGQVFLDSTPVGLIVTDGASGTSDEGAGGQKYLAEMADAGQLTRIGTLPPHDDLAVSTGGSWMAWTPAGTLGGEVSSLATLRGRAVDGDDVVTLSAPGDWSFRVQEWVWEDDDFLLAPVTGPQGERLARCSVPAGRCVLIDVP